MKHNYFKIIKKINEDEDKQLNIIHLYKDIDILAFICNKYLNTKEYAEQAHKDPYGSIYCLDLKEYLKNDFPDEYNIIKKSIDLSENDILDDNIKIYLGTSYDYRQVNEEFDNQMKFLEYINSEISEMDKNRPITEDILKDAGFIYLENESNLFREAYKLDLKLGKEDYKEFRLWTKDKFPLKLDIDNGQNNRGTSWHLHIDNNSCETIGCADIDNVWEFNTLMQVFKSKFRL